MSSHLSMDDLRHLATCCECSGSRILPDIFGEYVLCDACAVLPRDPFEAIDGGAEPAV